MSNWPGDSIDWRGIRPGDLVTMVPASSSPTAQRGYVVTKPDGRLALAYWDSKSAVMAQHMLDLWAAAGQCTRTKREARKLASGRQP